MHIPSWPQSSEREIELLREVLDSPHWGGFHPFVEEFERSFAAYQHAQFGISVFNGTVALEAVLSALAIGPGDEVIVPAISFIATATAVSRVGATPVFVDIGAKSFNLDPDCVLRAIGPGTRAIVAVHFGGTMCAMQRLEAICREHKLVLIEDAAHAHGSEWKGRRAGSFGAVGSFSFQNGKVLTAGEGGMLITSGEELAAKLRSVANCGRVPGRSFYDHPHLGSNLRMTAFQAAVLIAQFERLPQQIVLRTANARRLQTALADLEQISWQEEPEGTTQNSFYLLTGRAKTGELRNRLCRALAQAGVPCTPFYPHTLYQNELYRSLPRQITPCPVAEESVKDAFWLSHRLLLAKPEVIDQVAALMRTEIAGAANARPVYVAR